MDEPEPYRPINKRRRLLIAMLAVATAVVVMFMMTRKAGLVRNAHLHPADVAACTADQTEGCVGSATTVIAMPPAEAASR
jgi:hypothetical protein